MQFEENAIFAVTIIEIRLLRNGWQAYDETPQGVAKIQPAGSVGPLAAPT